MVGCKSHTHKQSDSQRNSSRDAPASPRVVINTSASSLLGRCFPPAVVHRVDQFTSQKMERGFVIEFDIAKWVGKDFCHRNKSGLDVFKEEKMNRSEE